MSKVLESLRMCLPVFGTHHFDQRPIDVQTITRSNVYWMWQSSPFDERMNCDRCISGRRIRFPFTSVDVEPEGLSPEGVGLLARIW